MRQHTDQKGYSMAARIKVFNSFSNAGMLEDQVNNFLGELPDNEKAVAQLVVHSGSNERPVYGVMVTVYTEPITRPIDPKPFGGHL